MKVKNIMTRDIVSCNSNDSLKDASLLMLKNDIGFLPVEENKKVIGVITDRDLVIYGIANENDLVKDCMNECLITIDDNDSIKNALNIMATYKVKRLLVRKKKKLVGIISISDIVNNVNKNKMIVDMLKQTMAIDRNDDTYMLNVRTFEL